MRYVPLNALVIQPELIMNAEQKLELAMSIIHDFVYQDQIQSFPSVGTAKKYGELTGEYMLFTDDGIMSPDSKAERDEIVKTYGEEHITEINSPFK